MKKQTEAGFTIVEILIGLGVMTTLVLAMTVIITNLGALNDRARDLVLANGIAENKVESLRSAEFVALTDGVVDFEDELPSTFTSPRTATYTVSSVNAALKLVEVDITYNDGGKLRELMYTTHVGELGVGQ